MSNITDPTEVLRRERCAQLAAEADVRQRLEERHGQVWDTDQLQADFEVRSFLAPFVLVRRKSDGVEGTVEFQARPRFYFRFEKA